MRCILLILALLCYGHVSCAQASVPLPQAEQLSQASAATDTAAAIHQLFAARRKEGHILTGIIVGGGVVGFAGESLSGRRGFFSPAGGLLIYSIAAAPYELLILLLYSRYTKKAEARALAASQAQQLSPQIKRRLKAKYFQVETAVKDHL